MLIFKIGEYEIENKKLSTTLNQLSKIECEDESVSISGTIISIENTPYILSRISLNVENSSYVKTLSLPGMSEILLIIKNGI